VQFVPKSWENTYFHWMENIEPWCISRQLWWGHQIPVWYGPDFDAHGAEISQEKVFCAASRDEVIQLAQKYYGPNVEISFHEDRPASSQDTHARWGYSKSGSQEELFEVVLFRDPDVLDTWFSSALWPFSTLGWPEETPELKRYYPTSVLVTGFDIIFFWVARMMMDGLHFMKDADGQPLKPFDTVYVHALVRDEHGKKMSKSLGNVIDPLEIIDQYGADALRFTLTSMAAMGRDIKLAVSRVEGYRNFATKLWNAARFAEMNGCFRHYQTTTKPLPDHYPVHTVNKWIVGETARIAAATDAALESYRFNDAANGLYAHVWGVLCDWYVELSKPLLQGEDEAARDETRTTMAWALDQCLKLLHPIMPFVTEELWNQTADREKMLIQTPWPTLPLDLADPAADAEMGWVIKVIEGVRSVRAEMNVAGGAQIEMVVTGADSAVRDRLSRNGALIERLARLSGISLSDQATKGSVTLALEDCALSLPLAAVIDVAAERTRLRKAQDKADNEITGLKSKLSNEKFLTKAPEEVVAEQRDRLAAAVAEREKLAAALARLAELV
jgi:valyl-tRNA synthetase